MSEALPLAHIKVIDLTRARAGPSAVRQFADWGADVIMVEAPEDVNELTGTRYGSDFQNLHRNKRSVALDLKSPEGRAALLKLAETADVLFENFRPDVKHRLGIDYETLSRINPRLVYASISGFGEDGPYAGRPGVDQIAQGMSGLMSVTGLPGQGPVRAGAAITDVASGLYCALGAMTALLEREVTGKGRWVRTSLLQAGIGLLDFQAARWVTEGHVPGQEGNHHPTVVPMGMFQTADGYVNLCATGQRMFASFCKLAERPDLLADPRYSSVTACYENRVSLREEVAAIMRTRSSEDWIRGCAEHGLPCGPVNTMDRTFEDPQVRHLGATSKVRSERLGDLELLSQPIIMADVDLPIRTAAPERGEHNAEIMAALASSGDPWAAGRE
jgi:formyl-CoA transferase